MMAKRKGSQLKKEIQAKTKNDTLYSRRARKKVNYAENITGKNDTNSDTDFETQSPHINPSSGSDEENSTANIIISRRKKGKEHIVAQNKSIQNVGSQVQSNFKYQGMGNQRSIIKKPNLSEDESSDSSDDEIPLIRHKGNIDKNTCSIEIDDGVEGSTINEKNHTSVKRIGLETKKSLEIKNLIRTDDLEQPKEIHENFAALNDTLPTKRTPSSSNELIPVESSAACTSNPKKRKITPSVSTIESSCKHLKVEVEDCKSEKKVKEKKANSKSKNKQDKPNSRDQLMLKKKKRSVGKTSIEKKNVCIDNNSYYQEDVKIMKQIDVIKTKKIGIKEEGLISREEESEDDNWEDVDEAKIKLSPKKKKSKKEGDEHSKNNLNIQDLQISVGVKSIHQKKKKSREEMMLVWIRQVAGRFLKGRQILLHKGHLLFLLAKVLRENRLCNNEYLKGICFSLVPMEFLKPPATKWDVSHLRKFLTWFQKNIPTINELLLYVDKVGEQMRYLQRTHIFVILLRALGFSARLVVSLQPCTAKVREVEISHSNRNSPEQDPTNASSSSKNSSKDALTVKNEELDKTSKKAFTKSPYFEKLNGKQDLKCRSKVKAKVNSKSVNVQEEKLVKKEVSKSCNSPIIKNEEKMKKKVTNLSESNKQKKTSTPFENISSECSKKTGRRKAKRINYAEDPTTDADLTNDVSERKQLKRKLCSTDIEDNGDDDDDDDDFDLSKEKRTKRKSIDQSITYLPSQKKGKDSSECKLVSNIKKLNGKSKSKIFGTDLWVEVYITSLHKWITVELSTESINEPQKCEGIATKPLQYVIGIDNGSQIKDITCRYAEKWLSFNRKLRVDRDWWAETLEPYKPKEDKRSSAEDAQLKQMLLKQDFPKAISEFKDNPLYALKRHLLKFEAIYPESAVPLGYIRKEAIYSRDCVHTLHTRETWMKQARTVKQGEEAYKLVKGRPKRNTPVAERDNLKVEVFGHWQTEVYVPPPVIDGKVPKNEYGNVELFQASMLPKGAVHLPMSNMQRIAKKLNIDYAPAMMGWDFHGGWSHPVIEGVVVAKEFEVILMDAWTKEEEENEKKEKIKRENIIYQNWKTLIRGILIRHKLKNKYKFEDDESTSSTISIKTTIKQKKKTNLATAIKGKPEKKQSPKKDVTKDEYSDLSVSWPMNRMGGTSSLAEDGHVHVFPESSHHLDPVSNVTTKTCSCGLKMSVDTVEKL